MAFQTIMEMVNKRRSVLQTLKDEKELKELNEKLHHYYSDCKKLQALAGRLFFNIISGFSSLS